MKGFQGFVSVILVVASTQAAGSGPYLPSGWKPDGPAFLLPGEIEESPAVPLKPAPESIAAGSDTLREYGPPKLQEVTQEITQQALPDEAAGPTFFIIRTDFNDDIKESEGGEVTTETESESEGTLGTTEEIVEDYTETQSKAEAKSIKFESVNAIVISKDDTSESKIEEAEFHSNIKADDSTVSKIDESIHMKSDNTESFSQTEESAEVKSDVSGSVSQVNSEDFMKINLDHLIKKAEYLTIHADEETANAQSEASEAEIQNTEEKKISAVNNIAEALVNLEEEIKTQQVHGDVGVKKVANIARSDQPISEGFLEYGPPGFKEYGPPSLTEIVENHSSTSNEVDNNEARRRRFSPKFKTISSRKHSKN